MKQQRRNRYRFLLPCRRSAQRAALRFVLLLIIMAEWSTAAPVGYYSLDNFTLSNSLKTDGSAFVDDAGTLAITGGNSGSGLPGDTDLTIPALASGQVSFVYRFTTLDEPGLDFAGYLLNGVFTLLGDISGQSGIVNFPVASGETFGFRVSTFDNAGEPGILEISDFEAPVPEANTIFFVALGLAAGLATSRMRER